MLSAGISPHGCCTKPPKTPATLATSCPAGLRKSTLPISDMNLLRQIAFGSRHTYAPSQWPITGDAIGESRGRARGYDAMDWPGVGRCVGCNTRAGLKNTEILPAHFAGASSVENMFDEGRLTRVALDGDKRRSFGVRLRWGWPAIRGPRGRCNVWETAPGQIVRSMLRCTSGSTAPDRAGSRAYSPACPHSGPSSFPKSNSGPSSIEQRTTRTGGPVRDARFGMGRCGDGASRIQLRFRPTRSERPGRRSER